jgi:hypothetical protein
VSIDIRGQLGASLGAVAPTSPGVAPNAAHRHCHQKGETRRLAREGLLQSGMHYGRHWSCGGEPSGNIGIRISEDHVRLCYTWTPYGADRVHFDYTVWIDRTPCNYGGMRVWFRCPRCQWRRAVLYGTASDGRFGCRGCMRLAYASECESMVDRINRRSHKLKAKLADNEFRPKWMCWRTFDQIRTQINALDDKWAEGALARFGGLIAPFL